MIAVYVLRDPCSGDVRYVGQTGTPESRVAAHLSGARGARDKSDKDGWLLDLADRGALPVLEIVTSATSTPRARRMEAALIRAMARTSDLFNVQHNPTRRRRGLRMWKMSVPGRMSAETVARLDAWRKAQRVPPSRSAAVEALTVIGLDAVERESKAGKKAPR